MKEKEFASLLDELEACKEASAWAEGKTLAKAWKECERGDWMLWLVGKMANKPNWPTRKQVVLAACDCAELALKYVKAGEDRPRIAIETARKWARGEATLEEVRTARRAAAYADAAYAADAAAAAAADDAAYAADAAAAAAYAAAAAAADDAAAYRTAKTKTLKQCADLVRKSIKL